MRAALCSLLPTLLLLGPFHALAQGESLRAVDPESGLIFEVSGAELQVSGAASPRTNLLIWATCVAGAKDWFELRQNPEAENLSFAVNRRSQTWQAGQPLQVQFRQEIQPDLCGLASASGAELAWAAFTDAGLQLLQGASSVSDRAAHSKLRSAYLAIRSDQVSRGSRRFSPSRQLAAIIRRAEPALPAGTAEQAVRLPRAGKVYVLRRSSASRLRLAVRNSDGRIWVLRATTRGQVELSRLLPG